MIVQRHPRFPQSPAVRYRNVLRVQNHWDSRWVFGNSSGRELPRQNLCEASNQSHHALKVLRVDYVIVPFCTGLSVHSRIPAVGDARTSKHGLFYLEI